jgi:hypothetical protein
MISKLFDFISIVTMLVYSFIVYIYNYVQDTVYRNNKYIEAEAEEEEEEQQQEEEMESFQVNNTINAQKNNTIEEKTPIKLYRENDFLPKNAGDYNTYAIEQIYPNKLLLPHNYMLQTRDFESKNTEYDYVNFNNLDGAGVHLQGNWETNEINRPWFETCLSPMNCALVPGNLQKFNYNI